jgi:hypothetical protein
MNIYLAGKVPKGDEIGNSIDWRIDLSKKFSELESVKFLSPEDPQLNESFPILVFGHDCNLIKEADLLIVNAPSKLGVGTSQEMIVAKYYKKPVVTILPKDTHHRRSNLKMHSFIVKDWIHPFIYATSDIVVENIDEAVEWVREYIKSYSSKTIKGIEIIEIAINEYLASKLK